MTTYAYDPSTSHLLAIWPTGAGATATAVARLHARTAEPLARELARGLTQLSATAWLSYSDSDIVGPFPGADAVRAIEHPNLPRAGRRPVDPRWLVESAHDVGRTLVEIGSAGVRRAVVADVRTEFAGIEQALRGDLDGRARQAVELTRLDASPVQIAAADRLLYELPMGAPGLFTDVEPTAACVAAAHWLWAAVDVTLAVMGGDDVRDVLDPGEAAEPFDVVAPRVVLGHLQRGGSPLAVVQRLVRGALTATRGFVPDMEECDVPGHILLDPTRPSRHLLDRLVMALRTCGRVHREHLGPVGSRPGLVEEARQVFDAQVRAEAERAAARLSSTEPVPCP